MAACIALKDESWTSEETEQCEEEHDQEPRGQSDGVQDWSSVSLWSHSGLHIFSFRVCYLGTSMFCCLPTGLLVLSSGGLVGLSQSWTGLVL